MAKVLFLSDFTAVGSGYLSMSSSLCEGLCSLGHEVKAIGLGYREEEHNFPYGLIPCSNYSEASVIITNLHHMWKPDVLVAALDIPAQLTMLEKTQRERQNGLKFTAITPLENGPLRSEWAMGLFEADKLFFISDLGTREAAKRGLSAETLMCGINTALWKPLATEQKHLARKTLGFTDQDIVILTVADNQERKNLWASMQTVVELKSLGVENVKYALVTKEHVPYGWGLRDMADTLGISNELIIFERGMPIEQLSLLYSCSDIFLLTSKAEGLSYPVLEAMASGLPVVATDTGAIPELLADGRGELIPYDYKYLDVWGNSWRHMASPEKAALLIIRLLDSEDATQEMIKKARSYVEGRTQQKATLQLHNSIVEILNATK